MYLSVWRRRKSKTKSRKKNFVKCWKKLLIFLRMLEQFNVRMISKRRFFDWIKIAFVKRSIPAWPKIIRASLRLLLNGRVTRPLWRSRIRSCTYCPVYNFKKKVCRPEGTNMGCGCYVPYLALVKENNCWGKDKYGKSFGWKI